MSEPTDIEIEPPGNEESSYRGVQLVLVVAIAIFAIYGGHNINECKYDGNDDSLSFLDLGTWMMVTSLI